MGVGTGGVLRRAGRWGLTYCSLLLGVAALAAVLPIGFGRGFQHRPAVPPNRYARGSVRALSALPSSAQAAVSAALGRSGLAYGVERRSEKDLAAVNPTQRLRVQFTPDGVSVFSGRGQTTLGLGWLGRPGALLQTRSVAPGASANRVSYARPGMRESYLNGPAGLEQRFDVGSRPAGAGPLELVVGSARASTVRLEGRGSARLTLSGGGALTYSGLEATDARGRPLQAWLGTDHGRLSVFVDDRRAAYPVHIDPFVQQGSKLVGTVNNGSSEEGFSVALSGDGNTALVGAPCDTAYNPSRFSGSAGCSAKGATWVFVRSGATWSQQAELVDSNANANANQGTSVALSTDGNTALIGGPGDNVGDGAAYVFTRSGSTWSQGPELVASSGGGGAEQGFSVALSGDGNTALIGGPQATGANGASWVFTNSGGTWSEQAELPDGSGLTSDTSQQGYSVALSSDGSTAVVGSPQDGTGAGAARVYARSGSTWSQVGSPLFGLGATGSAQQGSSVALSADGATALVGGPHDNGGKGATWVFVGSGGSWSQQGSKLVGTGGTAGDQQGSSVALSDDGSTGLIGGPQDSSGKGATWVFTRSGTSWSQEGSKLVGSGASGAANQGTGVALSGDGSTALVGGPLDNGSVGAAWAFVTTTAASDPAITAAGGQSFSGTAPATISGTVATFSDPDPTGSASAYSATIDWGDGTSSAGAISGSAAAFTVTGTHTYTAAGSYTIVVTITDNDGSGNNAAVTDVAGIASASTSPGGSSPPASSSSPGEPVVVPGAPFVNSSTSASESSSVTADGLATTAYYQYGLDQRYLVRGGSGAQYDHSTAPMSAGSGFTPQTVTSTLFGLVPNALYHIRLVAYNAAGAVYGPDQTFMTKKDPPPGPPVLGQSFNAEPVSGLVFVRLPEGSSGLLAAHVAVRGPGFVPLTEVRQLPMGTQVDTRTGAIKLTTASGKKHQLQPGTFTGAIYSVKQVRTGRTRGLTTLKLLEGLFPGAPSYAGCKARKAEAGPLAQMAVSGSVLSTLHSSSHGHYSSSGHYGSATSRGTAWTISDRCDGTLITVQKDTVVVRDFVRHKTLTLHAGQHYLARR